MLFGARLLQKTAMLVTSAEREVEPSIANPSHALQIPLVSWVNSAVSTTQRAPHSNRMTVLDTLASDKE